MRVISLFSGIGGLDLGLKLAVPEARTVAFVEADPFARSVLEQRMRDGALDRAPIFDDVCTFDAAAFRGECEAVVGGFPCQDISVAGRGEGIVEGNRSGLFHQLVRTVRDSGARWVFLENVAAIVVRGLDVVTGELAALGFDAEWTVLRASDVGATHRRARWFCVGWRRTDGRGVAHTERVESRDGNEPARLPRDASVAAAPGGGGDARAVEHAAEPRRQGSAERGIQSSEPRTRRGDMADAGRTRRRERRNTAATQEALLGQGERRVEARLEHGSGDMADAIGARREGQRGRAEPAEGTQEQRDAADRGGELVDAAGAVVTRIESTGEQPEHRAQRGACRGSMADADSVSRGQRDRTPVGGSQRRTDAEGTGRANGLADSGEVGRGAGNRDLHAGQPDAGRRSGSADWPPGPGERERWAELAADDPACAPAIPTPPERLLRREPDGFPAWVVLASSNRRRRLAALGNAVVPQQAGAAYRELLRRAGFGSVTV